MNRRSTLVGKTTRALGRRLVFATMALLALAASLALRTASGQEGKPEEKPAAGPLEAKFQDLLKKLDALRSEVDELRRAAEPPAKPDLSKKPLRAVPPGEWAGSVAWRPLGPAGMGGRITDLAIYPSDPSLYWVATASGGLLKTTNNGITFEHQFDREATVSIGAVAVAPSDPKIVWVGTGEANPRNSVSYGDGVYKSTDGGKTWKNMGLKQSFQIGRICIHPSNPQIVYVGALGRLYGPNPERGVFKTIDGGETWERVLFVDERTGTIELAMHPREPDTLLAAMWDRQRDEFDSHRGDPPLPEGFDQYDPARKWAPGSGLYKTTDGGKSWRRLNANPQSGLPTGLLGRMDVEYYAKDPQIVYAIIDCERIGMGTPLVQNYAGLGGQDDSAGGAKITNVAPNGPAAEAGLLVGDRVIAAQTVPATGQPAERVAIGSFIELTGQLQRRAAGEQIQLEIKRGDESKTVTLTLAKPRLAQQVTSSGGSYLGITGESAEGGARLSQVVAGGPAERAGLKPGDLVVSLDKLPLPSYTYFAELLRKKRMGDRVALVVRRGDQVLEIVATMGARSAEQGAIGGPLGLAGTLLGIAGEATREGLRISAVADQRPADVAGLRVGDRLTKLEGNPIADVRRLSEALGQRVAGDTVKFTAERTVDGKSETRELTVTLIAPFEHPLRPYSAIYAGQEANIQDFQGANAHEYGGIYKSTDGGETWKRINSLNPRPMYFSQIRVDPSDDRYVYVLGVALHRSPDGGATFTSDGARAVHADHHALWIDPRDGRHMILGTDGGFYATYDRAETWDHFNHLAIAQFYHVAVDNQRPYWVYGGLQDNGSWGGPSRPLSSSGLLNEDWRSVGGGDGFVCRVDPFDPDIVYSEMQNGSMNRLHVKSGRRSAIRPASEAGLRYRFNWNTPFILSHHNPGIFYCAGNYVFRSVKRGDDLKRISPEITRTGRGSATAVAESPRDPDVVWAGTDDGALWVTRDGGQVWKNVADKVGLPGPRWVATIEASRHVAGRCYVAFDGHRSNDDEPYVFVTEDFGETWKSLRANLPWGSTRCLREDPVQPDLLFAGTEFAVFASIDRGQQWFKINNNLPTVAVHELAIHPTASEMVAATHGRSLWIADIAWMRQLTESSLKAPAWLFAPTPVTRWQSELGRGTGSGNRRFSAGAPPNEALLRVSLNVPAERLSLKIVDIQGATVRDLLISPRQGLQTIRWDLAGTAGARRPEGRGERGSEGPGRGPRGPGAGGGGGGRPGLRIVPPGEYRVVLTVEGQEFSQTVRIESDPRIVETGSPESEFNEVTASSEAEDRE